MVVGAFATRAEAEALIELSLSEIAQEGRCSDDSRALFCIEAREGAQTS
jgi:hypothetical protein